ncbi:MULTISPECIES: family 20 glycosylhydrolase [unclassified Streptomyces]|uniref:family 20 glycosylhydrolase n=1 Tax=unclassified Streptomyces TaxID=2593676 RepID=UPI00324966CE
MGGIVRSHGKRPMAWDEAALTRPGAVDLIQVWWPRGHGGTDVDEAVRAAARRGAGLVMSPADHTYLDMKYDADTPLGTDWAGTVGLLGAYGWDPAAYLPGRPWGRGAALDGDHRRSCRYAAHAAAPAARRRRGRLVTPVRS